MSSDFFHISEKNWNVFFFIKFLHLVAKKLESLTSKSVNIYHLIETVDCSSFVEMKQAAWLMLRIFI